jgi:uncharacterized membrane protein
VNLTSIRNSLEAVRAKAAELYRQRAITMFIALALCSAASIIMLAVRVAAFDSWTYAFLVWNLFLAWVPFLIAFVLYRLRMRSRLLLLVAGCAWLAFFPNAPYILTDLIHLKNPRSVPIWYDSVMIVTFAWTGLFLGLVSLRMMQSLVRRRLGNLVSWGFAFAVLALSGFGIYLGRFERWNSWEVVTNPRFIFGSLLRGALDPFAHPKALAVTALMATFLTIAYIMTSMLLPQHAERGEYDF